MLHVLKENGPADMEHSIALYLQVLSQDPLTHSLFPVYAIPESDHERSLDIFQDIPEIV